jgi:voltage-gated potassium channel Kch
MRSTDRRSVAGAAAGVLGARPNLLERRMAKFMREPPSVRTAASVIVTATALVVVGGGVLIRVLDHSEYPNIWVGMWWALQTVTTVGYGDVTPKHASGRLVGVLVMLEGIAFLAITTAAITSTFIARAADERKLADDEEDAALEERLDARFDDLSRRFDHLEAMLRDADG